MASPGVTPAPLNAPTAKVVLLGDSAVGKSSIAIRFTRGEFVANIESTIGAAFLSRTVLVPSPGAGNAPATAAGGAAAPAPHLSRALKYQLWDTAGQERYRSIAPVYYRGAAAAIVVYDITNSESLKQAQTWIRELRANTDPTLIVFLVGNKKDLESLRQVSTDEGRTLAAEEDVSAFFETSAKDNLNIEALFVDLAGKLLDSGLATSTASTTTRGGARRLEAPTRPPGEQQGWCC